MAARFQAYESRQFALATSDWIRITQNGITKDKHRLDNGDLKQVKGFTTDGDIKLINGRVISKGYRHKRILGQNQFVASR
jgi:hypothetical protein